MRLTLGLAFCFLTITLFGNDGAYTTSGGNIYPIIESDIKMLSEKLSFVVKEKTTYVNVEFEFFNPGSKAKSLQVGFQAPSSAGDVDDKQCNTPQITGFTAQVNDKLIPYQLFAAECETCELKDTSEIYFIGSSSYEVRSALMFYTREPNVLNEKKLTLRELRIIRNTIYAQKGYDFKDEALRAYFNEFQWYLPDPCLPLEEINLSSAEKAFIEEIRIKEKNY